MKTSKTPLRFDEPIAIVGMAVDLPGAPTLNAFWDNLRDGVESVEVLDEDALLAAGECPGRLSKNNYVAAAARLKAFDEFDAEFFGFSAKEAAIMDPQHRKFLEVSWGALENAGHVPDRFPGDIGVYAGCGMGSYFYFNICSNPDLLDDVGMFLLRHTGNDKDFLATRVSHIFDLKGPSINVQTACSTSLVAVHYACNALRQGDCDMALAGGVTIEMPHGRGYLFKENEILSPDGHCHAFDHRAQGTVFGSGAGCVALRRLSDAQADGDHIWAIIRGSAINNDGANKASYLAPSVDGQAAAIQMALEKAEIEAETVDYVECHGTGTYLGDPIEVSALTQAYRQNTDQSGYCRIGSVKTNIGHLDTAAGVASLAKATLAMKHRQMPPSLHFEAPNPAIDFDSSPFKVNTKLRDWDGRGTPRRAGVNSLGVGGTNAHAILEEAPDRPVSDESDWPFHVICVSGRSKAALDANSKALATYLRSAPNLNLADVAWTLKEGRTGFENRRVLVAETASEAAELLEQGDRRRVFTHDHLGDGTDTIFMFPGGGAQYTYMARDLYETEPVFAEWMDRGLSHLQAQLDYDIRQLWLPDDDETEAAETKLKQPSAQLPLIMIVEYALAQLWMSWGVKPSALLGHSMGENTAACLAGVISFEDCIDLVLLRGRLFDQVPKGGMLSVSVPVEELEALIGSDLDIASVNGPRLTAVSGPDAKLDALIPKLEEAAVDYQQVAIDIAAHSRMLDPILEEFRKFLRGRELNAPQIPIMSNRTGVTLTNEQATDPEYWVEQLRNRVEFGACVSALAAEKSRVYLEVGPGKALSSLAQMCPEVEASQVLSSLRHPDQEIADDAHFLSVIGRLWACGVEADWAQIWGDAKRQRLPLPGYAFQRRRYFIEPGTATEMVPAQRDLIRNDTMADWGYRANWKPQYADTGFATHHDLNETSPMTWAFFMDETGFSERIAERLEGAQHRVVRIHAGDTTDQIGEDRYSLASEAGRDGYETLFALLDDADAMPDRIGHFWLVTRGEHFRPGSHFHARNVEQGFMSLAHFGQVLADTQIHISVFTNGAEQLSDEALAYPEKAMIAGPAGVIPKELPGITIATIDIDLPFQAPRKRFLGKVDQNDPTDHVERALEDLLAEPANTQAIWRGARRFEKRYEPTPLDEPLDENMFRHGGTYLITGGIGGIGLTVARDLLERFDANVVLLSRSDLNTRRKRAVDAMRHLGGNIMLAKADVCNPQDMSRVANEIEARFGKLSGVIHAAGTINDGPALTKDLAQAEAVLAPKVNGLRILNQLYPDGAIELMVLFSSSSTVTRPAGQIDYVAANEYLNAFAKSRRHGKTRVVSVNWGVWADTGMAAKAMAERTGQPEGEWSEVNAPLLDEMQEQENRAIYRSALDTGHWIIDDHRTAAGDALLPGTGFVELAAEAFGANLPFEIRDMHFLRAVDVPAGEVRDLRIKVADDGELEIATAVERQGRHGQVLNAQAFVHHITQDKKVIDVGAILKRCTVLERADQKGRLQAPQEQHLRFGKRWHVLRETRLGEGEGVAHLSLPDDVKSDLLEGYVLHPGLLDPATGWAMHLIPQYRGTHLWVPLMYQSIKVLKPLPADLISWVRLADCDEGYARFDITLADPDGHVCVEISGFQIKRLDGRSEFGKAVPLLTSEIEFDDTAEVALSPDEERLHHNISQGIRSDEGAEAMHRALSRGYPEIVVSSLDLSALVKQAEAGASAEQTEVQAFERSDLSDDFVAPRTATEQQLAKFWEKLLGVSPIGATDSFFDLGGHSLIAVRLFAMIKKEMGTEFPISVLFDAPTIESVAALIEEQTGGPGPEIALPDVDAPRDKSFTHLVALNRGDASQTPVFIVAGMFGNVLNLRHLAQQLGPERPVYGLQARGLIGHDEPHTCIKTAARDYLDEIRQIQPVGPYLLSGFSGGGITAYEMAQQIESAGDKVAMLAMLDTPLPVRPGLSRLDKALIKFTELRRKGPAYFKEWALSRLQWELQKRETRSDSGQGFNNHKIEMAFRQAVSAYELEPWEGRMLLFRPPLDRHWKVSGGHWVSRKKEYVFEDNQWTGWAPKTDVIEVMGDHDSMVLDPNVASLAKHIKVEIDRLENEGAMLPAIIRAAE